MISMYGGGVAVVSFSSSRFYLGHALLFLSLSLSLTTDSFSVSSCVPGLSLPLYMSPYK